MGYIQLNELYIGKEPILPLQNQLTIIRNKIKNKPFSYSMNTDKDILKFNRMVEKLFGFHSFALNISPDQNINAYTFGTSLFQSDEEIKKIINGLRASNNGFYYNTNKVSITAICTLNLGTINYEKITDAEIIAVMLHEIGHNFFESVTDKECIYSLSCKFIKILSSINKRIIERISSGKELNENIIDSDINEIIRSIGFYNHSIEFFDKLKNIKLSLPHSIFNAIQFTLSPKFFKESMDDNMNKKYIKYTNEKFADSFAVMYGYGLEIHSFLRKAREYYMIKPNANTVNISEVSKKTPGVIFKIFKNTFINSIKYALALKDPHPNELARIKVSIDLLKAELAKESLDPKVKLELVRQINDMQKLIDDYINFPKDQDSNKIRRAYYIKLYKKFGGDKREKYVDNNALFNTIDKRFDELLNN